MTKYRVTIEDKASDLVPTKSVIQLLKIAKHLGVNITVSAPLEYEVYRDFGDEDDYEIGPQ